ncbi:hypothetical protein DPMN_029048 [Dreissena polymorpha]|uniref:Uncharacterized protein n=1 Tax=Dreissena polymorpha TaxID=45954 RepID=A0A9D4LVS2_DREPO|nr:hypothetical protein DPMN_029048 [Dreissena polymorpha]
MATMRHRDSSAIVLSHCRHRTIALSPSYYRIVAIVLSHYRIVALWTLMGIHDGTYGIPYTTFKICLLISMTLYAVKLSSSS